MSEENVMPLDEVLKSKRFKVRDDEYAFVSVGEAKQVVNDGFVPSPREYDVYPLSALTPERPFGDTRVQPTAYMERRPEYEEPRVAGKLNKEYGRGNWRLVELKNITDPNGIQVLKLMLKEGVAREKFGKSA